MTDKPGDDDLVFTFEVTGTVTARLTRDEARAALGLDSTPDDMLPLAAGLLVRNFRHHYASALTGAGFLDGDVEHPWYELKRITTPGSLQLFPEE